jgi:hypothetical protein
MSTEPDGVKKPTDDDILSSFLTAVRNSRYQNRRTPQRDEQPQPVNMNAEELHRYRLSRMLHEALHPAKPEHTWRALFKNSSQLANELFPPTDEQLKDKS